MAIAYFQFYAELNDFLPRDKRHVKIPYSFTERASIKDTIESLGVPHPEINCIEVNGKSVDFSYIVRDGDNINVYPISTKDLVKSKIDLQPKQLNIICFVLDIHLGKLATSLRLLGFDTLYRNDYEDEELAKISHEQSRILLTRDKGLLMRSLVTYGYYVRSTNPQQQIVEVLRRFDLFNAVYPFQRCLRCNGLLKHTDKEVIVDQLPETVQLQINEFHRCQDCGQVYWKGSHYERLQQFVESIVNNGN
ncbi:Mut7-C ubiquitin/RNAse domain-containing protein [Nostocaceae cyanobacterium CENA369]|uniref:Mut7-C ubiquitin/RNAse domain-containing protein n=1 Tax=Dendronalium phyllosphericum CENA369 TaxID=1725256 RepID=A0A8J7I393_9NOST|nr:Mut7-C ubiquitin/RNAse domain-containing protein [Dendronalium phyllosphericum]MBH8573835.1 Mut7-C ubiquitin/RNAse domain-containing protein [Dendronalium phyllosphericum CENA369]